MFHDLCCATGGLGLHSNQDGDDVRTTCFLKFNVKSLISRFFKDENERSWTM